MRIRFDWTCPYCGLVQTRTSEKNDQFGTLKEIAYCDAEDEDGCGRAVALFVNIEIATSAYQIHIPSADEPLTDDEAQTLADYGDEIAQTAA